jgi:hypothetical protein
MKEGGEMRGLFEGGGVPGEGLDEVEEFAGGGGEF